jgi:hypothetical protein
MIFRLVLTAALALVSSAAWSHGEDKPGPHGGFIKMPGAFHTELLLGDSNLKVYLLDMSFKNPLTENSSLTAKYKLGKASEDLSCTPKDKYFECALPASFDPKMGEISVQATRQNARGIGAKYPLPLKLKKGTKDTDHSTHH